METTIYGYTGVFRGLRIRLRRMLSAGIFQGVLQDYSTGEISVFYALWGLHSFKPGSDSKGRTDRYDIGRQYTGQIKDDIHWKYVYMCIGEGLKDGAHCYANQTTHCLGVA